MILEINERRGLGKITLSSGNGRRYSMKRSRRDQSVANFCYVYCLCRKYFFRGISVHLNMQPDGHDKLCLVWCRVVLAHGRADT